MATTNEQNPQRYNEFRVELDRGKIVSKTPTARGHVSIHPGEAEIKNHAVKTTKLYYELAESDADSLDDFESASEITKLKANDAMRLAEYYGHDPANGKEAKQLLVDEWERMRNPNDDE
jgi:hypothetical protein